MYTWNRMKAQIEEIKTYRLILDCGCHIDLKICLYIPDCTRNLIFIGKLDDLDINFKIRNNEFSKYKQKVLL